jgi:hypothetical protein
MNAKVAPLRGGFSRANAGDSGTPRDEQRRIRASREDAQDVAYDAHGSQITSAALVTATPM